MTIIKLRIYLEKGDIDMPEVLTVKEASKILKISKTTLYRIIRENGLKAVKVRNSIRIKKEDLFDYINNYGQAV